MHTYVRRHSHLQKRYDVDVDDNDDDDGNNNNNKVNLMER